MRGCIALQQLRKTGDADLFFARTASRLRPRARAAPYVWRLDLAAAKCRLRAHDAVADRTDAIRSSIRSRSTSQYFNADKRSLSGWSLRRASSGAATLAESFAVFCSFRRALLRRHLPRLDLAPSVTIVSLFCPLPV